MRPRHTGRALAAALATLTLSGVASADVIMTMTYDDLGGTYAASSPTAGMFTARAVSTAALRSQGNVSRIDPDESALFDTGFKAAVGLQSDFVVNISVLKALPTSTTALGSGRFTATDVDGDTITGDLDGTWLRLGPGFIAFNGSITNVALNDTGEPDGIFNGTGGTGMHMNLAGAAPYEGALVALVFGASDFFTRTVETPRATGITAQIVPAPGAVALAGLGGLLIRRRR